MNRKNSLPNLETQADMWLNSFLLNFCVKWKQRIGGIIEAFVDVLITYSLSFNRRFIGEGHFAVDYTPLSVGDHQVEVKMGDIQVQGSPFVIKAFDVSKVNVTNVANGFVGKPGGLLNRSSFEFT